MSRPSPPPPKRRRSPTNGPSPQPSEARTRDDPRQPPLPSEALLRGRRLVEIAHNGEVYRLQATRLGKLILTK
jgi:hemin uptake protein HemP